MSPYGKSIQPRSKTSEERASVCFVGENLGRKASVHEAMWWRTATPMRRRRSGSKGVWELGNAASKSGRLPMIILENPAQPFAADHFPGLPARLWPWHQDLMVQSLMRAFLM